MTKYAFTSVLITNQRITLTLSTTTTSTDPLFVSVCTILNKFSAESGCDISRFSVFTPIDSAREGSNAFSTSRYAQ